MLDQSSYNDVAALARLTASQGDASLTDAQKRQAEEWYMAAFHRTIRECGCKNRYSDALFEILDTLRKKTMKYTLNHGKILRTKNNDLYSHKTITDDVVEAWYRDLDEDKRDAEWRYYFGDQSKPQTEVTEAEQPKSKSKSKPKSKSK